MRYFYPCLVAVFFVCILCARGRGTATSFFAPSLSLLNSTPLKKNAALYPRSNSTYENNIALLVHDVKAAPRPLLRATFIPWLYFMAVNMNLPNLPKLVNFIVNKGTSTLVSGESQRIYGNLSGLDQIFTFLSVNAVGMLSDRFGRRPFMMYSALGLGTAFFLSSCASPERKWIFYLAGCLDGLTSCMFSQSQAYISDLALSSTGGPSSLSVSLSQFQGISFMLGIPLGGFLGSAYSLKAPLYCAMLFCGICFLSILFFLPESITLASSSPLSATPVQPPSSSQWLDKLNPFGALSLFSRTPALSVFAVVYGLLNIAQSGIQIVWINYLQRVFGWAAPISALTLAIVGLTVAIFPGILIPIMGPLNFIQSGLLLHSLSLIALGNV